MRGRLPKDPALRQRRNQETRTTLESEDVESKKRTPSLPKIQELNPVNNSMEVREWHAMTKAWWRDIWRSPMIAEYLQADVHTLYRLAVLIDDYWRAPSPKLSSEIRLLQTCFGLTPLDRMRLKWETSRAESAERKPQRPQSVIQPNDDPRKLLQVV